jgi:hypothetical protein
MLRDDAFKAELAGMGEDGHAVSDDMLVELDAGLGDLPQEMLQPTPAFPQRLWPQIDAGQLQQVEGLQEHPIIIGLAVQLLKVRHAVAAAVDRLAVQDQGVRAEGRHGCGDERKLLRPIGGDRGSLHLTYPLQMPVAQAYRARIAVRSQTGAMANLIASRFIGELGDSRPDPITA